MLNRNSVRLNTQIQSKNAHFELMLDELHSDLETSAAFAGTGMSFQFAFSDDHDRHVEANVSGFRHLFFSNTGI